MSYVEGPKSRVSSIIAALAPAENISVRFKPGCVQCGNLLETLDLKKTNFSGKCFNCEHWINDDDEWFEDLED